MGALCISFVERSMVVVPYVSICVANAWRRCLCFLSLRRCSHEASPWNASWKSPVTSRTRRKCSPLRRGKTISVVRHGELVGPVNGMSKSDLSVLVFVPITKAAIPRARARTVFLLVATYVDNDNTQALCMYNRRIVRTECSFARVRSLPERRWRECVFTDWLQEV